MPNLTEIKGKIQIDHDKGKLIFIPDESERHYPITIIGLGKFEFPLRNTQLYMTIYGPASQNGVKLLRMTK